MTIGMIVALSMIGAGYVASKSRKDEVAFICVIGAILFIGY